MVERIIAHFGMHKTGSSSIQESLYHGLESSQFQYVDVGKPNCSQTILRAFHSQFRRDRNTNKPLHPRRIARARKFGRQTLFDGLKRVTTPNGVISGEAMMHLRPKDLEAFFDFVSPFANEIIAVGYVRSPKQYLESSFQERLKAINTSIDNFMLKLEYKNLFLKYYRCIGRTNVSFWKFNPSEFVEKCVVKDFCSKLSIDLDQDKIIRINESLSKPAVQLLYIYRQFHTANRQVDRQIVKLLGQLKGPKFHFHSDMYKKIIRVDQEQLAWIEKQGGFELREDLEARDDIGIRTANDMVNVAEPAVDWLSQQLKARDETSSHNLKNEVENIADALSKLGHCLSQQGIS